MKTKRFVAFVMLLTLSTCWAVAQTNTPGTNAPPMPPANPDILGMVGMWNALIIAIVPLVIAGIKWAASKVNVNISGTIWPIVAPMLGVLANWLIAEAGKMPASSWQLGAMCGAAGVGVREVIDQLRQYFASKATPPAPQPIQPPQPPPAPPA